MRRKPNPIEIVIKALKQRDLTFQEVRQLLERRGLGHDSERAIAELQKMGLLNDKRIAELTVFGNQGRMAVGDQKLVEKLLLRGVDPLVVEEAVATQELDELSRAQAIIDLRFGGAVDDKALRFLWSRGFSEDTLDSLKN
ncbi:MAG TPA: RecX family transcriptional regulator [Fimbriimonas sp.]|nr:RecX family transcriptional regulator [Fimbriimonas sp.]